MMQGTDKIKNILILSAILLAAGCSDDINNMDADGQPLVYSFTAVDETRAVSSNFTDYTGTQFAVYATDYTPSYASAANGKVPIMENVKVTYDGASCSTEYKYYWTKGELHFAAYSPYTADPSDSPMRITVPSAPYAGYSFQGIVEGRTNYMFADEELGSLGNFASGVVPLKFRHALSKVTFAVRLDGASDGAVKLNVKSLELKNIRYSGNVSFTHDGKNTYDSVTGAASQNKWLASNANDVWDTKEFPAGSAYDNGYLKNMAVDVSSLNNIADEIPHNLDDCLYLMPQMLYLTGSSEFVQLLNVEYELVINGEVTASTATVPLYRSDLAMWNINRHIHYTLSIQPPGGTAELNVEVQPWDLEERSNEFSDIVTIDNESDRISWTDDTYQTLTVTAEKNELIIKPDINVNAEFSFKIAHPLGATWYATLRTMSGNPNAFRLVGVEGATIVDGVAVGAVGDKVTLAVQAMDAHPTVMNVAELYFVVRCNGEILPVDILTSNNKNFVIIQNINI